MYDNAPQSNLWKVFNSNNSTLPSNGFYTIGIDTQNNLWLGGHLLYKWDRTNVTIYNNQFLGTDIPIITGDSAGYVWISLEAHWIIKTDGTSWNTYNFPNSMIALAVDKNNNIWGGGGIRDLIGLYKFDGNLWTIYDTTNSGLPYPYVTQLTTDMTGRVWGFAGSSGGKALFSFDGNYWRKYNCPYSSFWLSTMVADKKGNIWFATDQPTEGIVQFNGSGFVFHSKPDPSLSFPTKLITDKLDNLWVCWETGIAEFSNNTWHVYKDTISHDFSGMVVDKFNNLWLSTFGSGVVAFNKSGLLLSNNDIYPTPVADIFNLFQNYPNPFNPSTRISYSVRCVGARCIVPVQIKVYDVLGNEVVTLVDEYKPAGNYEVEFQSSVGSLQLASGIYFYQLKAGEFVETKKMILLR